MIKFTGRIVQFGFGAVGKSFYEKVTKEIQYREQNYFVITRYPEEFHDYITLGGLVSNFITCHITKENFMTVFKQYLQAGDLLIDFADTVGTSNICDWCATENIMYINTGAADWPENWLNIFEQDILLRTIKEKHQSNPMTNRYPIVLQHGNNPGLVSHFVKAGIAYIVKQQYRKDKQLKALLKQNKFNEVAYQLGIKMIHVNDIDLQKIKNIYPPTTLVNTWCTDAFLFEMLSEATVTVGSHEILAWKDDYKMLDSNRGFLEFKKIAREKKCRTYYPKGMFEGFLVPHEETITIAKSLEVIHTNEVLYRPTVMFLYAPCEIANTYLYQSKVNDYPIPDPKKPMDCEKEEETIIRGYKYPKAQVIAYQENIQAGTEYVGILLIGENFDPVWVGNRIEPSFLYKHKKDSFWQTPTITPVAMSSLAAVCWMLKNKDKGGFYFPEDIKEYVDILKVAEKYISKTIYKTFDKEDIEKELGIDVSNVQIKDIFV